MRLGQGAIAADVAPPPAVEAMAILRRLVNRVARPPAAAPRAEVVAAAARRPIPLVELVARPAPVRVAPMVSTAAAPAAYLMRRAVVCRPDVGVS